MPTLFIFSLKFRRRKQMIMLFFGHALKGLPSMF